MVEVDFGVYHHTSREGSDAARGAAKVVFLEAFSKIGVDTNASIKVLDAGCGLGFLTYVVLSHYPKATVTAVDKFEGNSLPGNSFERAKKNAEALGISERVEFVKSDLATVNLKAEYDLAVSNLVFHNLWRKKRAAYKAVAESLKAGSYFLNGDLFMRTDFFMNPLRHELNEITDLFDTDFILNPKTSLRGYKLIGLRKKPLTAR